MGIGNGIGIRWGKVAMASGPVVNEAFEFTVKTDNAGTSAANQFTIPITSATPYNISTSDGQSITGATGVTTLTFPSAGTYTVKITESCRGWRFNGGGDRLKLLNISNWGVFQSTTSGTFRGASNMTCSATDAPINPQEYLSNCFRDCINFDGAIGNWDVSQVARFDFSFYQASNFNQPLADWDVSNGQYFGFMFDNTAFNQPIGNWNTSNALDMQGMFTNGDFNQNIDSWDVSNVTNMYVMFKNNTVFNQPLNSWNTSSVTSMNSMFYGASAFNQPIGSWDVSSVNNFAGMFNRNLVFNQPIGSWNVSSATDMADMFNSEYIGRNAFNQDLSSWDVSSVTRMSSMFGQSSFNQDISSWNVSSVTNMSNMFRKSLFNQPLNSWDVSNVTRMDGMFYDCQSFNQPLNNWNTSAVTNMNSMLMAAYSFDQDISTWDINQVTNFGNFGGYGPFSMTISTANYDALLVAWEAQVPQNNISITFGASKYSLGSAAEAARTSLINTYGWTITDGGGIFIPMIISVETTLGDGLDQFTIPTTGGGYNYDVATSDGQSITGNTGNTTITFPAAGTYDIEITGDFPRIYFQGAADRGKLVDIKKWGSIAWTSMQNAFYNCTGLTNVTATDVPNLSNVTLMSSTFNSCYNLTTMDVSNWDVSNITKMDYTFQACGSLQELDCSSWDTGNVTNMTFLLWGCTSLTTLNCQNWDVSNVTNFRSTFYNATLFNDNISGWTIYNGAFNVNMQSMFHLATSFNQPLNNWDVSSATNMNNMFNNADSFNQDISAWNTSSVTNMSYMFHQNNSFNNAGQPLTWDTSSVTNMEYMFFQANTLTADITSWNVSNVTNMKQMFNITSFNQDISGWDMSSVTSIEAMLGNNAAFNQPIGNWDTSNISNFGFALYNADAFDQSLANWNILGMTTAGLFMTQSTGLSTANYDATLVSWEAQLQTAYPGGVGYTPNISIVFGGSTYTLGGEAEAARTSLINTYGWTITDGGGVAEVAYEYEFQPWFDNIHTITTDPAYTYNYNVTVSTGETFTNQTGDLSITFADRSIVRTLQITGLFPATGPYVVNGPRLKYRIINWGSGLWRSLNSAFELAVSLTDFGPTVPNLQLCTSMNRTFASFPFAANIATSNLNSWDVSNVTSMQDCFVLSTGNQNLDISDWNTKNLTNAHYMFSQSQFNGDITNWDVSSLTNASYMFDRATLFNQNIGGWDVSSVQNFRQMFYSPSANMAFNQDISGWNTSGVNASSSGNMRYMLGGLSNFDYDLSGWDVTEANDLTGFLALVTNLSRANYDAILIGWAAQPVSSNRSISFNTSQYTLGGAAEAARNTLVNTYNWTITDGGGVTPAFAFTIDTTLGDGLSEYEIRTRSDIQTYNYDITTSDGQSITGVTGNYNITFATPGVYDVEVRGTFPQHWGFGAPDRLKLIEIKEWGPQVWSSWEYMFYQHTNLTTISATDSPNLSSVTNMSAAFQQTSIGSPDFSGWDVSNVTNISGLFRGASFNGNVSTWDVSNVTNMAGTFATAAFNSDITSWNVGNVTTFNECFLGARSFNQDISGWNTSSATSFRWMFYDAYQFNADISGWNTSSLTDLYFTFRNAIMFDQNISAWDINSVTRFDNLFLSTVGPSQANYDAILIGWEAQAPLTGKSVNFAEATYTPGGAAEAARTSLINTYGWTITDGGPRAAQTSGFLLDDYPGAAAAYSFRQLSSSTPVVAQLSTSSSSTDFRDFTGTEMQRRLHRSLGYRSLRTFYDQSGNGRHANDGNMTIPGDASGLLNGKPVALTYSGFGTMFTPQQTLSVDNSSIFFVGKIYGYSAQTLMSYGSSTASTGAARVLAYTWPSTLRFVTSGNNFTSAIALDGTNLSLTYGIQNGQNIDMYHDGQSVSGSLPSAPSTSVNEYFGLTNYYPTTSGGPSNSAEFIFYADDQSANVAGIRDNINEFYKL